MDPDACRSRRKPGATNRKISKFSGLEFVDRGVLRFDELGAIDGKGLVHDLAQFLSQYDGNGSRIAGVNRNRKRTGVTIIAVNGAVRFPNAVGMAGGMIVVTNEENFCPEICVQSVLGLNHREVIAGRDNAAVQNDEVCVPGRKNNCLLRAAAEGDAGQQNGGVIK